MNEPLQIAFGLGVAVFVIGKFLEWAPKVMSMMKPGHGAEALMRAGDRSPEFWQLEQRRAVADVIEPLMNSQSDILRELVGVGKQQADATRELTQEIRDDRAEERGRRDAQARRRR